MTPELIDLIARVIIGLVGIFGLWLISRLSQALKVKAEAEQASELDKLIYELVAAAEQQLKGDDPNGSARKAYVVHLLEQLGIKVSEEINARIEAAVYQLNMEQK